MKKFLSAVALLLLGSAFSGYQAVSATKEDVTVVPEFTESFDALKVGGDFRIVYCDASDTLRIVANETVIQGLEWLVEDSRLVVRYKDGKSVKTILGGKAPIIYIPAGSGVREFIFSGTTRMDCMSPIVEDELSFEMSGAARLVGEVKTEHLSVRCSGTVNATITGSAEDVTIRIDGASRVAAGEGFECSKADLDVNGAGIIRISCSERLSGKISGTSVVKYLGKPEVSIATNGLGSVTSID